MRGLKSTTLLSMPPVPLFDGIKLSPNVNSPDTATLAAENVGDSPHSLQVETHSVQMSRAVTVSSESSVVSAEFQTNISQPLMRASNV